MARPPASAEKTTAQSSGSTNPVLAGVGCAAVVAVGMGSLWVGLTGLVSPDHAGGLLRTVGGLAGFFVVFALTLVAAVRQK